MIHEVLHDARNTTRTLFLKDSSGAGAGAVDTGRSGEGVDAGSRQIGGANE